MDQPRERWDLTIPVFTPLDSLGERIAGILRGRTWLVVHEVAAGTTAVVERLREHGAAEVMVVASVEGVGDLPRADRIHYTRAMAPTIMGSLRAFAESIEHPSGELVAAVDEFDPSHRAMVFGQGLARGTTLSGRPVYGYRDRALRDLEDKTTVDALFDDADVAREPVAIVPVAEAAGVSLDLSTELGSVWVADNKEGWHGGGSYVRWVRTDDDRKDATSFFADHADTVRVMPFLDGLPCSIHGFVTGDGVAVFQPIELFIFRHDDRSAFFYAQAASFWIPPDRHTSEMRRVARSVGAVLSENHGYRGGFGIDGIATSQGFRPTELNPRLTIGHALQASAADIPLSDAETLLLAGDLDLTSADLEHAITEAATHERRGGMMFAVAEVMRPATTGFVFADDDVAAVDADAVDADGTMMVGPAGFGSAVLVRFDPARTPVGPALGPYGPKLMDLARTVWEVSLPKVTSAPDVWR